MTEDINEIDGYDADIQRVRRTDHGLSIEARIKRGTGTRDEEQYTVKAKGETADEALGYFEEGIQEIEDEYAERLRGMQPEIETEEEQEDGDS